MGATLGVCAEGTAQALARFDCECEGRASAVAREGSPLPEVVLRKVGVRHPPDRVNIADFARGRRVVLVGCPGAFCPVDSNIQVPGFLNHQEELKAKGVSAVVVFSVNDGAVMTSWAQDQGIAGTMVTFMADPEAHLTRALGLMMEDDHAVATFGNPRCKRCAILVQDGIVRRVNIASYSDDPAGERHPQVACVDKVIADLAALSDTLPMTHFDSPKLAMSRPYPHSAVLLSRRAVDALATRPRLPLGSQIGALRLGQRPGTPLGGSRPNTPIGATAAAAGSSGRSVAIVQDRAVQMQRPGPPQQ